jgi:hypothetical protein
MSIGVPVAAMLALAISIGTPTNVAAQVTCSNLNNPNAATVNAPCTTLGQTEMSKDCKSILACLMNSQNTTVWAEYMSTNSPVGVAGGCAISFSAPLAVTGNWGQGCLPAGTVLPGGLGWDAYCPLAAATGYSCGNSSGSIASNAGPYCSCVAQ